MNCQNVWVRNSFLIECFYYVCLFLRRDEIKEEFEEFEISSRELEAELEAQLDQQESKTKELTAANERLQMELETLRERLEQQNSSSHRQLSELEDEFAQVKHSNDALTKYIRELEQSNDDLERAKRLELAFFIQFKVSK